MDADRFDALTRRLGASGSRRRVLRGALGAALAALTPKPAGARVSARKRCLRRGGRPVPQSPTDNVHPCRCALTCDSTGVVKYICSSVFPDCACRETAEGPGFCGWEGGSKMGCSSSAECDASVGERCVISRRCQGSGRACTTATDCPTAAHGCVNGTCQIAHCFTPCPL